MHGPAIRAEAVELEVDDVCQPLYRIEDLLAKHLGVADLLNPDDPHGVANIPSVA